MKIFTLYDKLVDPKKLKPNPKNPQRHSTEQARILGRLFVAHGIRHPIIVSKRSGLIVAGHGRHMAALLLELKEFPVVYQKFDSEESEWAFMISDNAIQQEYAELDMAQINIDLPDMGPLELELLALPGLVVDVSELDQKPKKTKKCPECGAVLK